MNTEHLRDYQAESALTLMSAFERHGSALNGSETGTGKTYTTCALIRHYDAPTVVVAPLPLIPSWQRVGAFMGVEFDVINYEMLRTGRTPYGKMETREVVKNGRLKRVRKFSWHPGVKMVVFDEAHRCKALAGGLNAATMIAARRQRIPAIALTATPATTPLDLKALGFLLGLHTGSSWWRWLQQHGCQYEFGRGMQFLGTAEERDATMRKLRGEIFPEHGVRVCKKDIPNFPTTQILPELYRIAEPSLMDKLYGEMEAELEKLAARRAEDVDPNHALTKILRLREQVEMLKIPIALELIYDAYEQGRSVVVFCNFRETVFALSRRMQHIPHGTLVGGMRPKDLRRTVDDFQDNQLRALATVSEVGGVGLGFHDLTGDFPRETLIFPGWSALSFEQLTGRVQRDGAKSHSIQRVLLADGTIENHVYRALSTKLSNQSALTDEDFVPWRVKYPAQQVEIALKEKIDAEDNALVESVSSQLDLSPTSGLEEDNEIPF